MSNATDQARSTRDDARAFADAFTAADDAFTFGSGLGESRELTLAELGDVLAQDLPQGRPSTGGSRPTPRFAAAVPPAAARDEDELLTLDELGDALLAPAARDTDGLDFDFGTSAHERARRRTAARLDASPSARRRLSGPAAGRGQRSDHRHTADRSHAGRAAMADASAAAAERLTSRRHEATGVDLLIQDGAPAVRLAPVRAMPAALEAPAPAPRGRSARRAAAKAARPVAEAEREPRPLPGLDWLRSDPDRVAMWAVLLGIVLVLIAFTSGSTGAVTFPLVSLL